MISTAEKAVPRAAPRHAFSPVVAWRALRASEPYFRLYKRYFHWKQKCRIDASWTDRKDILGRLLEDGVVVIPNYLPAADAEGILRDVSDPLDRARAGRYEGPCDSKGFEGLHRLLRVDRISPGAARFFDDPAILGLAAAYVSENVWSYQRMAEVKHGIGVKGPADDHHFDDWTIRFKAFLYLTEVGPANAPFAYLKGSHRQESWRLPKELEYFNKGRGGSYGYYSAEEVGRIKAERGFEEVECTGGPGTLILTDTRGIHRGTTLREGRRVLLANYFDIKRNADTAGNAVKVREVLGR